MLDAYKELSPILYGEHGICFMATGFPPNAICFPAHWHDRVELLQIVSGSLEVYLEKEHVTAMPGQVVIIMPHMIHCGFSGARGLTCNMIAFEPETFCNASAASRKYIAPLLECETSFCPVTDNSQVADAIEQLITILTKEDPRYPLYAHGKIYEIISLLYQHCMTDSRHIHKSGGKFGAVLEYINSHYFENISVKDISRKFGYNEAYFCRNFKEVTGFTANKYIEILRLEMAQKLLQNSREDIQNIAWQCGFSDVSYFSNRFKQHFGISPRNFRSALAPDATAKVFSPHQTSL